MNYPRLRWIVASGASLITWLVVTFAYERHSYALDLALQIIATSGVFLFTFLGVHRLDVVEESLREHRSQCHALFEASGLAILLVDSACKIVRANHASELLTGWSQAELEGHMACSELFELGGDGLRTCSGICPDARTYVSDGPEGFAQLTLKQRGGKHTPVLVSVAPLGQGSRSGGRALMLWDITERKQLEEDAARRRRQAEGLSRIGREILAYASLSHNLDRILDQARLLFEMDLVAWGMLDEQARTVTWIGARGEAGHRWAGAALPAGGSVLGRLLLAGRSYITLNLAEENQDNETACALFGSPPFRAAVAVPYRVRDTHSAVLLCASKMDKPLTDEDVMLVSYLGGYLSTATENAELLGEVRQLAAVEERQRLARDMHDSVGQTLSYFGVRLHMIGKAAARGDTAFVGTEAADLRQVLTETHKELRSSIFELQQSGKHRLSLQERWLRLVSRFEERTGISVTFHLAGTAAARLPENVQAQLTRILQEALTNARNHSGAKAVTVQLEEHPDGALSLTISDDGCGFETTEALGPDQHHFGLAIMRERAKAVGADLEIRSMRGQGTTVCVRILETRRVGDGRHSHSARR